MPTDLHRQAVADAVRAEMARRRITAGTLAVALGINRVTLGTRLRGATDFSAGELISIAAYFGCPVATFFDEVAA